VATTLSAASTFRQLGQDASSDDGLMVVVTGPNVMQNTPGVAVNTGK